MVRIPRQAEKEMTEYRAVRTAAGCLDRSARAWLEVGGSDRITFLHNLCSNDIKRLVPHQGCYALLLNVQGKIEADLTIWHLGESHLLETDREQLAHVGRWLEKYLITERVTLADRSDAFAAMALQGPQAGALLTRLCAGDPHLEPWQHATISVDGHPAQAMRVSCTGEDGYQLLLEPSQRRPAWERLVTLGAVPVSHPTLEVLRIEAGIPRYGLDMDAETLMPETGLTDAVSYTKGCYLGQEIVERIRSRGQVQRRLVGLRLAGDAMPVRGAVCRVADRDVGAVTSAAGSPLLQQPVALAYLHRSVELGHTVTVELPNNNTTSGEVVALPFYRPKTAN
ncbi:MAG: aminomethyl transferase family protein [Candidatus Omnitrophica bacterium]|nr:aminomethyl transferase family protein [Candidatus Omnitrophota bacterium]